MKGGRGHGDLHHELGVGGAVVLLLEFPAELAEHVDGAGVRALEGAVCLIDSGRLRLREMRGKLSVVRWSIEMRMKTYR